MKSNKKDQPTLAFLLVIKVAIAEDHNSLNCIFRYLSMCLV